MGKNDGKSISDGITNQDQEFKFPEGIPEPAVPPVNYFKDLTGFHPTVSVMPTLPPKSALDQIQIYTNGATLRFCWYDILNNNWHYVTATA